MFKKQHIHITESDINRHQNKLGTRVLQLKIVQVIFVTLPNKRHYFEVSIHGLGLLFSWNHYSSKWLSNVEVLFNNWNVLNCLTLQQHIRNDADNQSVDLDQFADNISLSNLSESTGEPGTPRVRRSYSTLTMYLLSAGYRRLYYQAKTLYHQLETLWPNMKCIYAS